MNSVSKRVSESVWELWPLAEVHIIGSCATNLFLPDSDIDLVIRPGGILRHREWGIYEVGIAGPDGLLVRVGWPSPLVGGVGATG